MPDPEKDPLLTEIFRGTWQDKGDPEEPTLPYEELDRLQAEQDDAMRAAWGGMKVTTKRDMERCPRQIMWPGHFYDDGTCYCGEAETAVADRARALDAVQVLLAEGEKDGPELRDWRLKLADAADRCKAACIDTPIGRGEGKSLKEIMEPPPYRLLTETELGIIEEIIGTE